MGIKDLCFATFYGRLVPLLLEENHRQLDKWGVQDLEPFEWLAYTTEELGELSKSISEYTYRNGAISDIVKEAIQTATLSLKIAEMFQNKIERSHQDGSKDRIM